MGRKGPRDRARLGRGKEKWGSGVDPCDASILPFSPLGGVGVGPIKRSDSLEKPPGAGE